MESTLLETIIKLGAAGILGAVLWIVAKAYYADLKDRIAKMDAKIQMLEQRCDELERKNASLEAENGRLKTHEEQLKTCPMKDCHWKPKSWPPPQPA